MLISFTKLLTSIPRIQPVSRYKYHVFEEDEKNWLEGSERPIFNTVAKPVPSGALNRVWNATSLGAGMLSGAIGNGLRSGFKGNFADWVLQKNNIEKMAESLLKMRGAALKLGQFLSFLDEEIVPRELTKALERAREQAYIMPELQLESQMRANLGDDWESMFESFEREPFAAASIGQVHKAVYKGQQVAVKVQYPGVRDSIDSDIYNI